MKLISFYFEKELLRHYSVWILYFDPRLDRWSWNQVNAQSSNGNTPLHQAVLLSRQSGVPEAAMVDIIALLLQAGADPNLNNGGGSSPLALARQGAGLPMLQGLLSLDCAGAKVPEWKNGAASCADSCPVEGSPHGGACVFCPAGEICKTDILGCCAACPAGTNAVPSRVERFDRRGTEPNEPFEPFEFFQNRNFP